MGDGVLLDAAGHDHEHVASARGGIHDRGVVIDDLPDPSGLVRDSGSRRHAGGDPLVELLPAEDREHRVARGPARGATVRDRAEQRSQVPGRGGVVEPGAVGRSVLHAAQHLHGPGTEHAGGALRAFRTDALDQNVGREVGRACDHQVQQLAQRRLGLDADIQRRVRVILLTGRKRRPVRKRREGRVHSKRVVQADQPGVRVPEQLDHHRDLHGARRVEAQVGTDQHRVGTSQAAIVQPDGRGGCPGDPSLEASPQGGVILRSRRTRSADDQADGKQPPFRHRESPLSRVGRICCRIWLNWRRE